ncbi:MAG: thiamine-phosphate kinase [Candidatus Omnitrophota bacterium]
MLISKIGEFGLIERFRKLIKLDASVIKGSGDDCAVIKFDRDNYLLLTCDMIVEGVDFTSRTDPILIGRKAVAISISDIAACGGTPRYLLASLAINRKTPVNYAERIMQGMLSLAKKYKINIVGGDLSRAEKVVLDVSMLGRVKKKDLVLRSGAKIGDIIFVTGTLGGSILGKHLKFTPRLKEAHFLVKNFSPSAMIDISDGLAQDLGHILKQSNIGARLYADLIPQSACAKNLADALYSGEDFELLFTLAPRQAKKLLAKNLAIFQPIGEIIDKKYGLRLVEKNDREITLAQEGFRHF